ncbi:MAG TPA: DivIVA domain-containing protein [Candidatus Cloacimonetes bacterium]|nr:DivIVA domain-containing protein [Candidatus Cloacimonadota bacterium]HEX38336.1 DivIVA domain-containing protein [Candidatus Cloacimonadota bacterium]
MKDFISSSEIRGKDFNKTLSGYSKQEVDLFLQAIADQFEQLNDIIKRQEKEIKDKNDLIAGIEDQKDLIKRTLLLAEKLKDDTLKSADKEAKNIIKDAELSAKERVKKAKDYLSILEHDYVNLKDKKKSFLLNFKSQIKTMLDMIEAEFEKDKEDAKTKTQTLATPDIPEPITTFRESPIEKQESTPSEQKYEPEKDKRKPDNELPMDEQEEKTPKKPKSRINFSLGPNEEDH